MSDVGFDAELVKIVGRVVVRRSLSAIGVIRCQAMLRKLRLTIRVLVDDRC